MTLKKKNYNNNIVNTTNVYMYTGTCRKIYSKNYNAEAEFNKIL